MPRVGGLISLQINGEVYRAKGNFTYNLGKPKRDAVIGADSVHGYMEKPQVPFIEGEITDGSDLDLETFASLADVTVTLALGNGKTIVLPDAYNAGENTGNSEEGNISFRFESTQPGSEVSA